MPVSIQSPLDIAYSAFDTVCGARGESGAISGGGATMNTSERTGPDAEALESRRMLSAVVENGVLVVTGTPYDDVIMVWENRDTVPPNYSVVVHTPSRPELNQDFDIPGEGVRSVTVRALAGDDDVNVAASPLNPVAWPLHLPTRLEGGTGDDRLTAGVAHSFIYGGFGNDLIDGSQQSDWIDGGWGNDVISGSGGNDLIFGRYGNDALYGGAGDDRVDGGAGDDVLAGDTGNDRLLGGTGNDRLGRTPAGPMAGEPGHDFLDGGEGADRLYGGVGTDRIFGGPGRDIWLEGWTTADKDTPAERIDRTPDEPIEMIPATR
jgi:Ca2+-binding RTX toxin-like protein